MRYQDDDTLLGLEKAKRGQRPARGRRLGGGRRWTGSLSQRVRAARRLPQAVFKISSYSHGGGALWDRVNYVARDGELEVEAANGERTDSLVELERLVDDWSGEQEKREQRVVAMNAVVSFPAGVDQEKATEAAREFFREAFAENHDYIFAPHTDAKQFHVHVVVQAAGHDGKQLRITKDDIQELRQLLAEKAHEHGIELDASPRWARGLDTERSPSREVEGIERRGGTPEWTAERELEPEAAEALAEERGKRQQEADAGESQALEYARAAATLAAQIPNLEGDRRKVAAVRGAVQLAAFGWALAEDNARDKTEDIEDIEEAQAIIARADRALRDHIRGIESGAAKKEAIQAERTLSGELTEYRKAQREHAQREREAAREADGPELEPEL